MVALAPVAPETFKAILEAVGYKVVREDEFNWTLVRGPLEVPIILPKEGLLVGIDVLMQALADAKIDNLTYLTHKAKFGKPVN